MLSLNAISYVSKGKESDIFNILVEAI